MMTRTTALPFMTILHAIPSNGKKLRFSPKNKTGIRGSSKLHIREESNNMNLDRGRLINPIWNTITSSIQSVGLSSKWRT